MRSQREPMAPPAEVAKHLGVADTTLTNWRYLRRGPKWVKVGGRVRYRWEDVDAWLAEAAA